MELDMLETQVLSLLKGRFSKKIKDKKEYADLNFTTSDKAATDPKFPTVYVHMEDSTEIGETLEGTELCGINTMIQIDVSDNKSQSRADEIAREVLRVMKTMRFKAKGVPIHNNQQSVYVTTSRYTRIMCTGDLL